MLPRNGEIIANEVQERSTTATIEFDAAISHAIHVSMPPPSPNAATRTTYRTSHDWHISTRLGKADRPRPPYGHHVSSPQENVASMDMVLEGKRS